MNGQASDSEAFGTGVQGKVITPTEVSNSNAEWASSDAFSSAFDAFSNNKLENVSINVFSEYEYKISVNYTSNILKYIFLQGKFYLIK